MLDSNLVKTCDLSTIRLIFIGAAPVDPLLIGDAKKKLQLENFIQCMGNLNEKALTCMIKLLMGSFYLLQKNPFICFLWKRIMFPMNPWPLDRNKLSALPNSPTILIGPIFKQFASIMHQTIAKPLLFSADLKKYKSRTHFPWKKPINLIKNCLIATKFYRKNLSLFLQRGFSLGIENTKVYFIQIEIFSVWYHRSRYDGLYASYF